MPRMRPLMQACGGAQQGDNHSPLRAAAFPRSFPLPPSSSHNVMTPKAKTFCERLFSTLILLGLLGATVAWGSSMGYAILICLLCNLASIEWFRMLRERRHECNRGLGLLAGLAYPWLMAAWALPGQSSGDTLGGSDGGTWACAISGDFSFNEIALAILVLYVLIAFFCELYRMDYKGSIGAQALSGMGLALLSFIYPVWLFSFALYALATPESVMNLLWLVLVTKMSDIWAYVSGALTGGKIFKRPFSPAVSPKKTWEGIIGSFIITSACGYGLLFMTNFPFPLSETAFFCVLMPCIFIFSVAGDLAGSLIKRGLAVKDSGSLLPGIGGIFDLIDSPAFTVSLFVAVLAAL